MEGYFTPAAIVRALENFPYTVPLTHIGYCVDGSIILLPPNIDSDTDDDPNIELREAYGIHVPGPNDESLIERMYEKIHEVYGPIILENAERVKSFKL